MEIVGTVAVILGFGFFLTWVLNSARKKQQDFVTALGCLDKKYGLVIYPGTLMKASNAVGSYDGLAIKVDTYTVDKSTFTRVTVEGDLPKEIFIQGEGMRTAFKKLFVGEDVQIGESRFDDEVYVKGDAVDILSYMNADARRAIGFAMAFVTCKHASCTSGRSTAR